MTNPFPLPDKLGPELQQTKSYWDSLKRADATMPFWDDVKLSALSGISDRVLLLDVYADPERFRVNTIGAQAGDGDALRGKFVDDATAGKALHRLREQASATVASRGPTVYRGEGYDRILLPMWGDGRIGMLLGAVAPREA